MNLDHQQFRGVLQGPMGSMLRSRGITTRMGEDSLAMHKKIHEEYRDAGATIPVANTFGSTPGRRHEAHKLSLGPNPEEKHFGPIYTRINTSMVEVAQDAFGDACLVAGSVAPIADSSGRHDNFWRRFPSRDRLGFLMDRHAPQVNSLINAGADMILGEAFRYEEEAIAVVKLAEEFRARGVAICFEASKRGLPFQPKGRQKSFRELKEVLRSIAPSLPVWVGANCTGMSVIRAILERDELDIIYANSLDFNGEQDRYSEYVDLKKSKDANDQDKAERIEAERATPIATYVEFAQWAFERGVKVVGGCCGTTPELTRVLRAIWNRLEAEKQPQAASA